MMKPARHAGFTYIEVLLSAALLAVLLVPALQALQSGVRGGDLAETAARAAALVAKLEEVASRPFPDLYAETYTKGGNSSTSIKASLSDAVGAPPPKGTPKGTPVANTRRVVVLYRYDASSKAHSSGDTGLLYLRVYYESEGTAGALDTLVGRWW